MTRLLASAPAGVLAVALVLTGCASTEQPGDAAPVATAAPSPAPSVKASPGECPAGDETDFSWPEGVPKDLPTPPTAVLSGVTSQPGGLTLVRFSTSQSIRDGVLFLIEELPPAGYTLARGDAEASEADAPFVKGDVRGVMRIIATGQCQTDWLLALAAPGGGAATGGTPLLPPAPDASPLPFG